MEDPLRNALVPGAAVTVTQQIAHRDRAWASTVSGTVVEYVQKPTGSWFAHAKGDRLWLDRLKIRRPDGEIMVLNLDAFTRIEITAPATAS